MSMNQYSSWLSQRWHIGKITTLSELWGIIIFVNKVDNNSGFAGEFWRCVWIIWSLCCCYLQQRTKIIPSYYLPLKPMETGEGEGPGVPNAVFIHSISPPSRWLAEWLPIVLFNRAFGNHSANQQLGGLIGLYFRARPQRYWSFATLKALFICIAVDHTTL